MPFNKVNVQMTAAQLAAVQAGIDAILNNLPSKFNLTVKERNDLPNIADERYPYAKRGVKNHAVANPALVSGFAGTTANATTDFNYYDQLENILLQVLKVVEIVKDTQHVAGSEVYAWLRELYRSAKAAADNQVPGADAVADDLGKLFEGQGPQPPPVA